MTTLTATATQIKLMIGRTTTITTTETTIGTTTPKVTVIG